MSALQGFEGLIGNTPMRRLNKLVGRDDVEVWAKLESMNLGGSVKDRAALGMILAAKDAGHLDGRRIVEPTSGNTGIALAMIAALLNVPITLIMPDSSTPERRAMMIAYGAEVILLPGGMEPCIDYAHELHAAGTHFILDQFSNPANPNMHYRTTGPEIWRDTEGRVTHFVSSMGTTGTAMGVSRFLKEQKADIEVVGVYPEPGQKIPGISKWPEAYTPKILDEARLNDILYVTREAAEQRARALAREEGIFVGISAGGCADAALTVAKNAPAGSVIVFIVPDRGERYLSVPSLFPEIHEEG